MNRGKGIQISIGLGSNFYATTRCRHTWSRKKRGASPTARFTPWRRLCGELKGTGEDRGIQRASAFLGCSRPWLQERTRKRHRVRKGHSKRFVETAPVASEPVRRPAHVAIMLALGECPSGDQPACALYSKAMRRTDSFVLSATIKSLQRTSTTSSGRTTPITPRSSSSCCRTISCAVTPSTARPRLQHGAHLGSAAH